jgi:transposase
LTLIRVSKSRVIVLAVVSEQLTPSQAAARFGVSRQWVHQLLTRYHHGGLEAVDPRSRRPASNPRAVTDEVIAAIVRLREELIERGLDAGPLTLRWHLSRAGLPVPSTSTIRRILHHHGLITSAPRKRPKSSYRRFQAAQPNECWQSDFTHWQLADGSEVEILNWLDDHSRYLLACTAYPRIGGPDVVTSFTATATTYGLPALQWHQGGPQQAKPRRHIHVLHAGDKRRCGVLGHKSRPQSAPPGERAGFAALLVRQRESSVRTVLRDRQQLLRHELRNAADRRLDQLLWRQRSGRVHLLSGSLNPSPPELPTGSGGLAAMGRRGARRRPAASPSGSTAHDQDRSFTGGV